MKLPVDSEGSLLEEGQKVKVVKGKYKGVKATVYRIFDNFGLGAEEADLRAIEKGNGKTTERTFTKKLNHLLKLD